MGEISIWNKSIFVKKKQKTVKSEHLCYSESSFFLFFVVSEHLCSKPTHHNQLYSYISGCLEFFIFPQNIACYPLSFFDHYWVYYYLIKFHFANFVEILLIPIFSTYLYFLSLMIPVINNYLLLYMVYLILWYYIWGFSRHWAVVYFNIMSQGEIEIGINGW